MSEAKSTQILKALEKSFSSMSEEERQGQIKKTNAVFQLNIKDKSGKENIWTVDAKNKGEVKAESATKPDATISMDDDTFVGLAEGKIPAQRAFMTGKLKVKGNVMVATKLDNVLKSAKAKL